jgi:GNAT superfamily N-acetyltransferase
MFMPAFTIRPAAAEDSALVLTLLTELSRYEKLQHKFTLTEAQIARDFFGPEAKVMCELAFEGETPVGLITWYWTYATFVAARGLYLEDLYVRPAWRGKGYGKALLRYLAAKAVAVGANRLEWLVLDWNAPAIEFYKGIGARQLDGWYTYRLEGDAMQKLGDA